MNNMELISAVARKATAVSGQTVTKQVVMDVMDALKSVIYDKVALEDIKLFDSLTLSSVYKEPRIWRHPLTGERIQLPEKYVPKAKFGKAYQDALNKCLE